MIESSNYFNQADPVWEAWGVYSHQDFLNKFQVPGKFHSRVPKHIIIEYEIVERLLCYSYYSFKLLDEAFSKVTRIFESAVKLRMEELELKVERHESLHNCLKKLEKYTSPEISVQWDKARKIRNYLAHPLPGQQLGLVVHKGFFQMVNILNTIFINIDEIEATDEILKQLKNKSLDFKNGLFKLEIDDKAYLVWSIIPHSCCISSTNELKSLWVFHPVTTYFPQTFEKLNFTLPLYLRLKEVQCTNDELVGIDLQTNKGIRASITNKVENMILLDNHNKMIRSSEFEVKTAYFNLLKSELGIEVVKFFYFERWG